MSLSISRISAEESLPIRKEVLWPGVPLEKQLLPFDKLPSTLHFGAWYNDCNDWRSGTSSELYGVLTITLEKYVVPDTLPRDIKERKGKRYEYQLHKFGVISRQRGFGVGRRLLEGAIDGLKDHVQSIEDEAKDQAEGNGEKHGRAFILFHFDARAAQTQFYQHLGFDVLDSEVFLKYGPTGNGPPTEYIRMGTVFEL